MQKTSRQAVLRRAKELGCEVEIYKSGIIYKILICAPNKHVWTDEPDIHELVFSQYGRFDELYVEALERMKQGVTPCTIPDCEWCEEVS